MVGTTKSVLIVASALGALAAPTVPYKVSPGIDVKGTHTVRAVPNHKFKANGPRALLKVLSKYNLEIPEALRQIQKRGGSTSVVAANSADDDVQYVCPVQVGQQTLNLDFDTGSADLWVFSSLMSKSQQSGHNIYKPGSGAKQMKGASWEISYGDGSSASGSVYTDTVKIGSLAIPNQAVELAKQASDSFTSDSSSDGLVGLAFGSINTVQPTQQKTWFENALGQLKAGVMSADLKHETPGTYTFGAIDSAYSDSITYVPVDNSQGFWQFDAGNGATAIADTGTTLLLVSTSAAKAYYKNVKGAKLDNSQGGYTFPCSANLTSFKVTLGSHTATIPGQYLNYAPISEGSSTCFGGVQGYDGDMYIYGDIFFKAFYSVFDYDNTQFGFAAKTN